MASDTDSFLHEIQMIEIENPARGVNEDITDYFDRIELHTCTTDEGELGYQMVFTVAEGPGILEYLTEWQYATDMEFQQREVYWDHITDKQDRYRCYGFLFQPTLEGSPAGKVTGVMNLIGEPIDGVIGNKRFGVRA